MTLGAGNGDTVEVLGDDQAAVDMIAALVEKDPTPQRRSAASQETGRARPRAARYTARRPTARSISRSTVPKNCSR